MKITKSLTIDSLSKSDTADLFNAICEKALNMSPRKAKKDILKLDGSNKELDEFQPSLLSLDMLIAHFDIKCELKVFYMAEDGEKMEFKPDKAEPVKKEMEKQDDEITNPALLEEKLGKKVEVVRVVNSQVVGEEKDIPDFE